VTRAGDSPQRGVMRFLLFFSSTPLVFPLFAFSSMIGVRSESRDIRVVARGRERSAEGLFFFGAGLFLFCFEFSSSSVDLVTDSRMVVLGGRRKAWCVSFENRATALWGGGLYAFSFFLCLLLPSYQHILAFRRLTTCMEICSLTYLPVRYPSRATRRARHVVVGERLFFHSSSFFPFLSSFAIAAALTAES